MAYSQEKIDEIFNEICDDIKNGESLRASLRKENRPNSETFYKWIDGDESKTKQYARACEERADNIFEDIISIADSQEGDIIEVEGEKVVNHDNINRARLRVDSRKWMLSKMFPKKYGDKIETNINIGKVELPDYFD